MGEYAADFLENPGELAWVVPGDVMSSPFSLKFKERFE